MVHFYFYTMKQTRSISAAIVIAFFSTASLVAQPAGSQTERTITVMGEAEIRVVPDEVVFNFGIETSKKEIDEARSENDRQLKDLLALARRLGIEEKHIQTDYLSIEPDYLNTEPRYNDNPADRKRQLIGYITMRRIVLTLKDLSKVEELIAQALKLGVNYVSQGEFRTTELRKYRDQARLNAIDAAREKALALATRLGVKLGRPISIMESSVWEDGYGGSSMYSRRSRAMTQNSISDGGPPYGGGEASSVAPGQISVTARVSVIFELE